MFQTDNIPSSKKNKDWLLKWGKDIASWHYQGLNTTNFNRSLYAELSRYLHGRQEVARHKPNANGLRNNNTVLNQATNFRNLKIAYKYLQAVHGKLGKIRIAPSIEQIDSAISDYKQGFGLKVKRLMELKNIGIQIDQQLQQLEISPEDFPQNDRERELFLISNPQIATQIEMQVAMSAVFEQSQMDVVRREIRMDLLALGIGGLRVDTQNGVTTIRRVNPLNAGTNICTTQDFRDIRFSYEIQAIAPENIRAVAGEEFSAEDYNLIQSIASSPINSQYYFGNQLQNQVGFQSIDRYCLVVDFELISTEAISAEIIDKGDRVRSFIKVADLNENPENPNRSVVKSRPQYVYKGKFIIGTNLIYDYGLSMQVRDPLPLDPRDNEKVEPGKAQMGFKWFMPGLYYGTSTSLLEIMLPFIDNAQKTWDQFTNAVFRLVPQAISIDIDAITDIALGNGNKLSPSDIINLLVQNGIDIYRSSAYKGMANTNANKGAQFKDNPATSNLERLLNSFTNQLNLVGQMAGITPSVEGGVQSPEIGKAVTAMMESGTDNVLQGVMEAEIKLCEKACQHMMLVAQKFGLKGSFKGKTYFIDPGKHEFNIYNCKINMLPSPEEWAALYADMTKFAAEGRIDPADVILIRKIEDYDQAYLQFAVSQKRMQREQLQMQLANQQQTFQGQAEVAQQSAAAEAEAEERKAQARIAELKMKAEEERKTLMLKALLEGKKIPDAAKEIVGMDMLAIGRNTLLDLQPPVEEEPVEELPEEEVIEEPLEPEYDGEPEFS